MHDDLTVTAIGGSVNDVQQQLQSDVISLVKWVTLNKLMINKTKTKAMLICTSRKRRKLQPLKLLIDGVLIEEVAETRLLGVTIQNNLSWTNHLTHLSKKVQRAAGVIGRIASHLPRKLLKEISHSLVYSQISYCCSVWGNATKTDKNRLQVSLNKAARRVLWSGFDLSVQELHSTLGWPMLDELIPAQSFGLFRKIIAFKTPAGIFNKLKRVSQRHQINTRNSLKNKFIQPKICSEMGRRTFTHRIIKMWNLSIK